MKSVCVTLNKNQLIDFNNYLRLVITLHNPISYDQKLWYYILMKLYGKLIVKIMNCQTKASITLQPHEALALHQCFYQWIQCEDTTIKSIAANINRQYV